MRTYGMMIVVGMCIVALPLTCLAALDWHIRWDETNSPQIASVYIFNPENTYQTFMLEIGDVAKADDSDPSAPYLIVGQNVSLPRIAPGDRKIFDIVVYRDIDSAQTLTMTVDDASSSLSAQKHQAEIRILKDKYGKSSAREYPFSIQGIVPVIREEPVENRAIYRNKRGYWIVTIVDHDQIAEHLIRSGRQIGAQYDSIQQAIFYYTQGSPLSGEALRVWEAAFPELKAAATPTPIIEGCIQFVTVVTSNLSYYSAKRTISVGDILASSDAALSPVVAAEDVTFSVSSSMEASKRALRVYLMSQRGRPSPQSEYVRIIDHNRQIEDAIRIGTAEQYHPCAIQDVIFYINHEVPYLTIGKGLWDRLGGVRTPTPPIPGPGRYSLCLGEPTVRPVRQQAANMTFKNLALLVGTVVPFGLIFRRKKR